MMAINTQNDGKYPYLAFFNGKQVELYADSSYQAQQRAIAHFKPTKSKQHMVHVQLVE